MHVRVDNIHRVGLDSWDCLPYSDKTIAVSITVVYKMADPPIFSSSEIAFSEVWMYDKMLDELPLTTTISIARMLLQ
jgi:hypothetical protein